MSKDGAIFAKSKTKGDVNYPPFEDLTERMEREVLEFQVHPLGNIKDYSRHIPYNSEKKSFLEKTGRESFEGTTVLSFIALMLTLVLQSFNISLGCLVKIRSTL